MFGPKDVAQLLEQLSSDLRAGAAAAAGDQQQQQDQDSRVTQPGREHGGDLGKWTAGEPAVLCCDVMRLRCHRVGCGWKIMPVQHIQE